MLLLVGAAAHADPFEVSVGPVFRSADGFSEEGARLGAGWIHDGGARGWRVDLQYTKSPNPGRINSTSLRVGWIHGQHVAPWLVMGTQVAVGADADSFPGEDGYTDGAIYATVGSELRATALLGAHVFVAASIDGNFRPIHGGNNNSDSSFTFDAGLWVGVR